MFVGCCDFVLYVMCVVGGVLLWVVYMFVSGVHLVAILSAVFLLSLVVEVCV